MTHVTDWTAGCAHTLTMNTFRKILGFSLIILVGYVVMYAAFIIGVGFMANERNANTEHCKPI